MKTTNCFRIRCQISRRHGHRQGLLARVRDPQQSEGQASILGDQPVGLRIRSKAGQATPQGVSGIS